MDKKKSLLNISISIISRVILLVLALVVRRLLIQHIGNDVNGLNALYTNIIGMLAVAELGVGSAIVFSMYKPIVEGSKEKVAALYGLYKRLYLIISAVIFAAGLCVMPFLPRFIIDYDDLNVDIYLTFFLTLVSVVLGYLYSAKTSLIEAHKNNYITTVILTVGQVVRYCMQIAVILIWHSYAAFLVCQVIETLLIGLMTEAAVRKKHGEIIALRVSVDRNTKTEVTRNVKAMFMHKIGTVLVNTADSIIISTFIGVTILGKYSNYTLIAGVVSGTIALFFTPLTSVIGHLCAEGSPAQAKLWFDRFYCLNYILGVVFFLGYYAVIDSVIAICFGEGLEMSRTVVFVVTLNQFIQYMRNACLLFRNASGTFYNDRWKPLAEGIINLILSLVFVSIFPETFRVAGVIAATVITNLAICHVVEPYVVFRNVFRCSPRIFCIRNYVYIALFTAVLSGMTFLMRASESAFAQFMINDMISLGISTLLLVILGAMDGKFRNESLAWCRALLHR